MLKRQCLTCFILLLFECTTKKSSTNFGHPDPSRNSLVFLTHSIYRITIALEWLIACAKNISGGNGKKICCKEINVSLRPSLRVIFHKLIYLDFFENI